jgi:DNA-binding XRE family transcriptional regulator
MSPLATNGERFVFMHKLPCYLGTFRRNWALTQAELGKLIGLKSQAHISSIEHGRYNPSRSVVLACEVVFGVRPRDMFPKLYEAVEDAAMARMATLYKKWERDSSKVGARKRLLAERAMRRIPGEANTPNA